MSGDNCKGRLHKIIHLKYLFNNLNESKKFYINILGFKLEYERVENKFAFLSYGDTQIMIEEINGHWNTSELQYPLGRGINFLIATDDVCEIEDILKQNNIKLFKDMMVNQYKCDGETIVNKEILFQDPDGYLLRFAQSKSI